MQPEKRLWKLIKGWFPVGSSVNRIESHSTCVGFPDVEYHSPTVGGVIELKAVNSYDDIVVIRPSQVGWLTKRVGAGDNPVIALYVQKESVISIIPFRNLMKHQLKLKKLAIEDNDFKYGARNMNVELAFYTGNIKDEHAKEDFIEALEEVQGHE